jgi:hypothetical protein
VIPTLILFGLIFGRWWHLCLVVATVGWPLLLVETDVMDAEVRQLFGAAFLAVINTGVGVLVHQGVRAAFKATLYRHRAGQAG